MRLGNTLSGLLLLSSLSVLVQSAKRYTRKPNQQGQEASSRYTHDRTSNSGTPDTGNSEASSNLNVRGLSDAIMSMVRPTINGLSSGAATNRNHRGNPNGRLFRQMPAESPELNYTVAEIARRFPWITNPESILQATGVHGRSHGNFGRPGRDGRTRFNNPKYLRDRFEGLNRDNYGFRVTQGVRIKNGKYKVKVNQDWRNLQVYGLAIVMEQENDTNLILESADGQFLSGIEDDIESEMPNITKEDAIQLAIQHNLDVDKVIQNPKAELIVDTIGDKAVLSYLINYFIPADETPDAAAPPITTTMSPETTSLPPYRYVNRGYNRGNGRRRSNRRFQRRGRRGRGNRRNRRGWSRYRRSTTLTAPMPTTRPAPPSEGVLNPQSGGGQRPWLLMNAVTGEIYKTWQGLTAYIRPSRVSIRTGNPIYGTKNYREVMYKDADTSACYYQKPLGGGKFLRVNDKSTSNTANVYRFRCDDGTSTSYDSTNGAASTRNSAFKWGSESINYLKRVSGTDWPFDINIETHHLGIHAVWNGNEIQLGDGDPRFFYPLTTPDTVTHEISHAFTEFNSNLEYRLMSGAINEAYSDMAASAFMDYFFAYSEKLVYKIGRNGLKINANRDIAIRDLCNPRSSELLLYNPNQLIIISALQYTSITALHNASALYSKAFCDLSKTDGWSIQEAFKVFTIANVIYWRPRETFNSGACGVKKATYDFKQTAAAVKDVDTAFAGVDIACDRDDWINLVGRS